MTINREPSESGAKLKWITFPHEPVEGELPRQYCETPKHDGLGIRATTFQLIWTPSLTDVMLSKVHAAWFTCKECAAEMRDTLEEISNDNEDNKTPNIRDIL